MDGPSSITCVRTLQELYFRVGKLDATVLNGFLHSSTHSEDESFCSLASNALFSMKRAFQKEKEKRTLKHCLLMKGEKNIIQALSSLVCEPILDTINTF